MTGVTSTLVARAVERGVAPPELTLDELRSLAAEFDEDISSVSDYRASVESGDSKGGVSARAIELQIENAERALR